jgi:CRP-like cAMP-binding protein
MNAIETFLAGVELLSDLAPEQLAEISGLAEERSFETDERVLEMDKPADAFHVLRSGRIAVEVDAPGRGPLIIETIGPGDVLGVSWLLPPYRWTFTARALEPTRTIAIDAASVRAMAERDPAFGYKLYQRFAVVIHSRLVSARVRALDLYGGDS